MKIIDELISIRNKAYSPYYKFSVGAVLITKDGNMYTGCNIENVTQGPGMCAENVAFAKAITDGYREFDRIYIMGGPQNKESIKITPCGVCRQLMAEFCEDDFKIINHYGNPLKKREYLLKDLLPHSFE